MPELPEVENFKKFFLSTSLNQKVTGVEVLDKKVLTVEPSEINEALKGKNFKGAFRHGKFLFLKTSGRHLVVMHFGMTGFLVYYKEEKDASNHLRVIFNFSNKFHLGYDCLRKFGRIYLTDNTEKFISEKKLGIDPLNGKLLFRQFQKILKGRSGNIKSVLMDQSLVSGIGNLYSDEILFQSEIHPASITKNLNERNLIKIFSSMNRTLKAAINKGDIDELPDSYLIHHRKKESVCPRCKGKIKFKIIGGRSSYFCTKHQKKY
jgi:formamidopyrimidine-DNA glycosylase